ncbi:glycosyltransferase [Gracilibacillus salitolerans]|uniref:Glycosyltransferase n=2 Tax=Gracilibacillus salitolerans TaxID=2663022 RepID=A0A5Q2TRB0_9BACI|nr:glycosyltransferase [Gracilibacillus salitolerans]
MNYGGAGKMLSFLANNLNRLGYQVSVYTYASDNNHYFLDKEIKYIPGNKAQTSIYSKKTLPIFQMRRVIEATNPDLIISFLNNSNFLSILSAAFKNIPVIICERSDPYNEKSLSLSFMRSFYRFASGAVFQTEGAKEYYKEIIRKKSIVIPNPVTIDREERIPSGSKKNEIAFVARFNIKQKRQDVMVKAFYKVVETHRDIKLVFYGDGPDLLKVQEMVKEYNLSDNVFFAGKVNDVKNKLKNSRMFVLTSDYEGIPNALIEAMAVGLPVVTTNCSPGGAELLIENGKNGLIVPTGEVDKIASAILFLIERPEVAEQYGEEAQKVIEKYYPKDIIKMWTDYINDVIKSG